MSSRRDFLRHGALAGIGFWAAGGVVLGEKRQGANDKINIACIGVDGKGSSDTDQAGQHGNIVALCDIDDHKLDGKAKKFPQAKKYNDYRKMFDEMAKSIDAVTVSTPDHSHALPSMIAMQLGKHVYCQKPLTHTVFEARQMRETAKRYKVATQMGNQGTAENGLRTAVEIIQSGGIGPVREVHVWTDRPIWPQGSQAILAVPAARQAALAALWKKDPGTLPYEEAPKHVHWDLFLGPAPQRPYTPGIHPFAWRGWWDYGTGALGDMACHTANMAFMALKLAHPLTVQAEKVEDLNPETYPTQAHVIFQFPARGDMPPVTFHWYEGQRRGKRALPKDELLQKVLGPREKLSDSGSMLVGEKGILYSPNDYGASFRLMPEKEFAGFRPPQPTLLRNGKGDDGMKEEWVAAMRGGPPAMSNFDYAGMLTETILLGNIAIRLAGKKLEWDGPNLKFTNSTEANQYVKTEYRKGWAW